MVDISISRADILKNAVSWLLKVCAPSDSATICFPEEGGMALIASLSDGTTVGFLSFGNGEKMDWFGNVSLQRLQQALDSVNDDKVHFYSLSRSSIILKIDSDSDSGTRSHAMIPVYDPDQTNVDIVSKRNQYPLKLRMINTQVFSSIIKFFMEMDTDKVFFKITDSQVTFTAGAEYEPVVLLRQQVEYHFNGVVPEEGGIDYFGCFGLEILNHMDFWIQSESVWIYPPDGELPAGLGCTVDAVCDKILYSLKQLDPRIFRAKPGESAVVLDRAARLRTAVSLLPGNTATFKFQMHGVFIFASSADRSITAMLELSFSNNFTCKQEEFFDVNIDDLYRTLKDGGDSDEVHISTHELGLVIRIRDPEGQDRWELIESDSVNLWNGKFYRNKNSYKVMAGMRTTDFAHMCFDSEVDHTVTVTVSNGQVKISSESAELTLFGERNGCTIVGFTEADTSSYVSVYHYDSISPLSESIQIQPYLG